MRPRIRRAAGLAVLVTLVGAPVADARAAARRSWATSAIRVVLRHHILPETTVRGFHPNAALDAGTLWLLVQGTAPRGVDAAGISLRAGPVTMGRLDDAFVRALGLGPVAARAVAALRRAGYTPRPDAGTELVAHLLRLRINHPASQDALERSSDEIASRAEAAWTAAQVLAGVDTPHAVEVVRRMEGLPTTTGARHDAIARAVQFLGQPYVWGGTWENTTGGPAGAQLHGGFDCSGLLWRVLAYDPTALPGTASAIGGRTTFEMARTTPAAARLRPAAVRPGDILLFGPSGRRTGWLSVGHAGLAMGNGLFIHSGSKDITIDIWSSGWYAESFAWGKSVLP